MPSSIEQWTTLFHRSLATRLAPETFETYVKFLSSSDPLPANRLCDLFLAPTPHNDICLDPRAVFYVLKLLDQKLVSLPAILRTLWNVSSFQSPIPNAAENGSEGRETEQVKRWTGSYSTEETLFYRLTKLVSSGKAPKSAGEAGELVKCCILWMEGVTTFLHAQNAVISLSHSQTRTAMINAATMALGALVVAVVESVAVQQAMSKGRVTKLTREALGKALGNFVPMLLQTSPQIAARLEGFRTATMPAIEPVDKKTLAANKELEDILEESMGTVAMVMGVENMVVIEVPVVNSRAGLYIYFNALLVGRPLIDDNTIFAYLHNRNQGDIQSAIVDLILAAFDILANATFRNERQQVTTILRSFLINKVPILLTTLCSQLFPPLTSEFCITEALSQVDTTAFPTLSNMFDESSVNNMFSDSVRQDFCFACCLHGLIAESSIEVLLGDVPMQSLPTGGRYVKELLVQQCLSDPARAEALIDEMEHMDGNVGAVSQAITEVIGKLCNNKETMALKSLCSQLVRRPSSLDIMLLFDKPTSILQPICALLDNWRYDEDQGEYQPVYEEFGSILLLVLSFTHRYNLSTVELGITSPESFIRKLVNQSSGSSRSLDELTPTEQSHLDGWIRGLCDLDSGGLGDELMSSCPPQDFYLLVATLFHQIVLASATKNLSDEGLRGGLEYLVDTFLLPSLVPGITFLSNHLWARPSDANAVLQILSALITSPTSISNNSEASTMLNAVLNIVAKNLEHSLRWLQRAEPSRQDIEPLSKALRANLGWERRAASDHTELDTWTATPGGGIVCAVKQTMSHLVHWALNPRLNPNPAPYTHRQLLVAVKMHGAKRVLGALIEEVKTQSEAGNASHALDVACALIAAPEAASWEGSSSGGMDGGKQRRLTLREALKFEAENAPKLLGDDAITAQTLVRLYRQVEAQCAMPQLMTGVGGVGADSALAGVNLGGVGVGESLEGLDMAMGGMMGGMDMGVGMGLDGASAAAGSGDGGGGVGAGSGDMGGSSGGGGDADLDAVMMDDLLGGDGTSDLFGGGGDGLGDGLGF